MQNTMTAGEAALNTTEVVPATQVEYRLRTGTVVTYLVLGCLIAVSSLLPWARIWFVQVSGLQWGLGWPVLIAGGVSAGMAGASLAQARPIRGLRVVQFIAAAAGIGMFALAYAAIDHACNDATAGNSWLYSSSGSSGSCVGSFMGIGMAISLLSGAALGLFALFRGPTG